MATRFRLFSRGTSSDGAQLAPGRDAHSDTAESAAAQDPSRAALTVRFWGVRGSYPATFAAGTSVGGATTCLEVSYGDQTVVIDAGSGAIALGEDLERRWHELPAQPRDVTLLFTHAHHDHLCGLPFFAPLFDPSARLRFYGPDLAGMAFPDIIAGYVRPPYFPLDFRTLPSSRALYTITDGVRIIQTRGADPILTTPGGDATPSPDALVIDTLFSALHPADGVMIYRITAGGRMLVFATDVEVGARGAEEDRRLIAFAHDADLLIHDAQFGEDDYLGPDPKRGYGHSTVEMAAQVALAAQVRRLALFHHDPHATDERTAALERAAQACFAGAFAAREGLCVRLDGPSAGQV